MVQGGYRSSSHCGHFKAAGRRKGEGLAIPASLRSLLEVPVQNNFYITEWNLALATLEAEKCDLLTRHSAISDKNRAQLLGKKGEWVMCQPLVTSATGKKMK